MVLNCDYVVAGNDAKFALPEVKRGVMAVQGGAFDSMASRRRRHKFPSNFPDARGFLNYLEHGSPWTLQIFVVSILKVC